MSYVQNRVYLKDYASLPANSLLLAPIVTALGHKQQYVHHLLVKPFMDMDAECFSDIGVHLLCASGRRDCPWPNETAYEKAMIAQYGSVKKGQKYRAFQSPHQTGLCIDLECGGLAPISKTIPNQRQTRLYAWLVENIYKWGFTPYLEEPWHIEYKIDPASYWERARTALSIWGEATGVPASTAIEATTCADANDVCEAPHDWVTIG